MARGSPYRKSFREEDEGKPVIGSNGDELGIVEEVDVDSGTATVDPKPGVVDSLKEALGWDDDGPHELGDNDVESITEDEVHLFAPRQ